MIEKRMVVFSPNVLILSIVFGCTITEKLSRYKLEKNIYIKKANSEKLVYVLYI